MNETAPLRVRFFDGQALTPDDLSAEQHYHVERLRRHLLGHHSWGIVDGLTLELTEENLVVRPGYAIDQRGRELVVPRDLSKTLTAESLAGWQIERVTVWLLHHEDQSRPSRGVTGAPRSRIPERPVLDIQKEQTIGGSVPPNHARKSDALFLGDVRIDPRDPQGLVLSASGRRYAGLVGSEIQAPEGRCRIRLGPRDTEDAERFSIELLGDGEESDDENRAVPVFTVRMGPVTELRGDLDLGGQLTLDAPLLFRGGMDGATAARLAAGKEAPWMLYRHRAGETDQLRLAMLEPPGSPLTGDSGREDGSPPLSVGIFADGDREVLTVSADGTVTVHGDLVVKGLINPSGSPGDRDDTGAAAQAIAGTRTAALVSGEAQKAVSKKQQELLEAQKGTLEKFFEMTKKLVAGVLAALGLKNPPKKSDS